jgi:hypothetical protein
MGKPACGPPLVKATSSQSQTPLLIPYYYPLLTFQVYSQSPSYQGPFTTSLRLRLTTLKRLKPGSSLKPLTSSALCLFPFHVESPPLYFNLNRSYIMKDLVNLAYVILCAIIAGNALFYAVNHMLIS